ncbi:MucR family transcriptional regulator [Methylobacterium sp. J-088]|uniref:MucR family transcriptional regulator n=1 Tax=Methylobacterium sp. J-088 TaxID=2836664 RepID=UPI001FBA5335|nr:MucR family transcriptional regulator [Methylobacterium sp. J-088]MCJ2065731.1 MucR family transcriptional regulator [Methylobacterium sp. J-088]
METEISNLEDSEPDLVGLTADIVSAYVSKNRVSPAEVPALLANVHAAIAGLGQPSESADASIDRPSAAQIRKSVRPDGIVSFLDGKTYKTLKRHLTKNGMTFDEYRARYGLPHDYPSVAASYSEQRSSLAKSLGLGQQRRKAVEAVETPTKARKQKKAAVAE